jgi:hypothetical protein
MITNNVREECAFDAAEAIRFVHPKCGFVFLAGNETDGRERFLAAGYLFHVRIGIAAGLERFDPMRLHLVLLPDPKHSDEKQGAESCPTYYYFLLLHAPVVVDLEIGGGSRT